jgi:hypothetical protein
VPYPTALDFFVFLSFAFIFATIIQVRELNLTNLAYRATTESNHVEKCLK